jgi:hypothetical protein
MEIQIMDLEISQFDGPFPFASGFFLVVCDLRPGSEPKVLGALVDGLV